MLLANSKYSLILIPNAAHSNNTEPRGRAASALRHLHTASSHCFLTSSYCCLHEKLLYACRLSPCCLTLVPCYLTLLPFRRAASSLGVLHMASSHCLLASSYCCFLTLLPCAASPLAGLPLPPYTAASSHCCFLIQLFHVAPFPHTAVPREGCFVPRLAQAALAFSRSEEQRLTPCGDLGGLVDLLAACGVWRQQLQVRMMKPFFFSFQI